MLLGAPMRAFGTQHRDGRTATHQAGVVGGDLKAGTVPELGHVAGRAQHLGREQRGLQQTLAVSSQNFGLLPISAEQNADRAFASGLVFAPIGA
jgi:hypothetical protein